MNNVEEFENQDEYPASFSQHSLFVVSVQSHFLGGISSSHCLFYLFSVNAKPEREQIGNQSQSLFEYYSMFLIIHILKRERTTSSLVFGI